MSMKESFEGYYNEYTVNDIRNDNSKYIFILESPHNDERAKGYPAAGQSGKEMADFIMNNPGTSLGKYAKCNKDSGITIINVSSAPLQEVNNLESNYKNMIQEANRLVRLGYESYGKHREGEINEIEKFILKDFEKRFNQIKLGSQTVVVVCGGFAKRYFKELKVLNKLNQLECKVLFVPHPARHQWSNVLNDLLKLKKYTKINK